MSKVNFQAPISGKDLQLPDLPPEEQPASDPLPQVTHAKSKTGVENILKRGIDLFRKVSTDKSRAHVRLELDKKIGARPNEESSTVHIKTRTQKTVSFSKSGYNKQAAVKSEPLPVRENKVWTRDELNVTYLTNGLIKVARDKGNGIDNSKKNELETAIRQLLSNRGEELNEATLKELKGDASALLKIPEAKYLSVTLEKKVDEALSKKAEAASKNLGKAEKIAMPAPDGAILYSKAEMLRESQSKLSVPDMKLDKLLAALDESSNIDEITAAIERMGASSQKTHNQPTSAVPLSALVKAEKIAMPAPNGAMLSAKAEKLRPQQSNLSAHDMTLIDEIAKSQNLDEITAAIERMGASSQNLPDQPASGPLLSAHDELERPLGELNDKS